MQSAVADLLRRFPKAGSMTIAKRVYKDNPELFKSLEAARTQVRRLRGNSGTALRGTIDTGLFRPNGKAGDGFGRLPKGLTHFADWKAFVMEGPARALLLCDVHIPYHEKEPLVTALRHGKRSRVDTVILNGDLADFFSVSFWEKDPRKRRFAEEVKTVREFLGTLRTEFPKARIVYKIGNHEERWERYMRVKAPELLDIEEFDIKAVLGLEKLGIELVGDKRPILFGRLNIIHGHEFRSAFSNPVNPARGFFLRAKVNVIGSHYHQTSHHSEKNLEGQVVGTWSTGCLCDLHPDYMPINSWNHGFAIVGLERSGHFQVSNFKIIGGRIYE